MVDRSTKEAVPFATVYVQGGLDTTRTDELGCFELELSSAIDTKPAYLVGEFLGFEGYQCKIKGVDYRSGRKHRLSRKAIVPDPPVIKERRR
ncbi:MAG: hypothetical protein KDB96_12290 [Flavobacteriales bacterium]|nr:hypothetical protein [Flavobacteriales bacterium]